MSEHRLLDSADKIQRPPGLRKALADLVDIVERQCFTGSSHYRHELPLAMERAKAALAKVRGNSK